MPRTIPAEFIELEGRKSVYAPVLLMEWHLNSGTRYFSSRGEVEWNGATWEGNRLTAPSVTFGIIDVEHQEFPKITLTLDNLPDNGDSAFPFQAIDVGEVFEDKLVILYVYSPDKETAFEFWRGRSIRPTYNGAEKTVDLNLSFIFDSLFLPVPSQGLPQAGFTASGVENNQDDLNPSSVVPLYYGVGNKKIRPVIYRFEDAGAWAYVNFIVSGCAAGLPFGEDDIINLKLFDTIKAQEIVFHPGGTDTTPHNLTKFPDGLAHDDIAYGFALFPWDNKDQDNIQPDDVRGTIANGRPLIDTGLPSENLPLIIKDLLRDPNHGLGAPDSDFDNDALAETADYTGTRYQARLEMREQQPLIDLIQKLLGECHCYIAWPNGQIQIRAKRNDEVATATFATISSGQSGILIEDDIEAVEEKGFDEIPNQLKVDFRLANRHKSQPIYIRDRSAQRYAGGNYQKVSQDEVEFLAIFDVEQAKISGAIRLREGLQGDIYIRYRTPFYDSLRVVHGDLANVYGKDILNNGSNYVFRVLTETWNFGDVPYREFYCKLYKAAIYNDDYEGLDIDLERTGTDTSKSGRPDDVTPISLAVSDPVAGDTGGKLITITATCTIPAFDPTDEIAQGIHRLPPIAAWEAWWRYGDESPNLWRRGTTKEVAQSDTAFDSSGEFQVDFYKNRSIEVAFVALPPSRVKSKLGYIPDPTKATHLMADLSAVAASASVDDDSVFAGAQYSICEFEVDKVTGHGGGEVSFDVDGGGHRKPYFESTAIAHPNGTQIAVAKLSYPSLTISLTPPRLTYLVVQNLAAKQRGDGVRFHWDDVSADNQEKYQLYWSTDGDANTNPAKLGSATPSWYTTDPKTPPAGVNLIVTDAFSAIVMQELIGAAGTTVYARVAARNGKNNYSSALSALANNKLGDDAVPSLATGPTLVPRQIGLRVKVILPTLNMKTFSTAGKIEIVLQARDVSNAILGYVTESGNTYGTQVGEYKFDFGLSHTHQFNIKKGDLLALFPTIVTLKVYAYVTNAVGTSAASPVSSLTVSTWEADAMQIDTAAPTGLNTAVLHAQKGSFVTKKMYATANDNQEQYKEVVFAVVDDGGALINYVDAVNRTSTASEATAKINIGTSGHYTLQMRADEMIAAFGGPANRNLKVYYYVTNQIGTSLKSSDSALLAFANFKADPVEKDTTVPTIPAAPTVIPSAAKIKCNTKPPTSQIAVLVKVEIVARVKNGSTVLGYIIDGTTPTNNATEFKNDNGLHFKDTFNWKRADIVALYPTATAIEFYSYVTNEIGTSAASAATSLNVSTWEVDPVGDDLTAPTGLTAPTIKRLKKAGLRFVLTAPTAGNLKLRKASVYIADGTHATATKWVSAADLTSSTSTEANGAIETSPTGGHTIEVDRPTLEAIFPGGVITLYATWTNDVGTSGFSGGTTYTLSTGEVGSVDQDIGAPTLATNPDTGTTGPTVRERHSKIKVSCPTPSANVNTLVQYQVIMSTQNTAPAGNPTVGSAGVLEINYGQNCQFNIPYTINITTGDLYFYFRVSNQFSGGTYSSWSAGTNQHGYSRPLQDGLGTNAPVLDIRLEASGTSPSAPAIANDATHYSISTSDTTDYQALITAGKVLHLHIPSVGASDRIRKATAYDLTNHRFTIDVAFGSTPGNNIAYEVHRAMTLGEKSASSGNSTTQIKLGTTGALLADGALIGSMVYAPSQPSADQLRRITAHSGGFITLDTAVAAALANSGCYMISKGVFGYAAINPSSGIIAGVPARIFRNADTTQTVIQVIMPSGPDAYAVEAIYFEGYRSSTGALRITRTENPAISPEFSFEVPDTVFMWRFYVQTPFRDAGSNGKSAFTVYMQGFRSDPTNSSPPSVPYDPATYPPIIVDYRDPANYPTGRFNPL